MHNLLTMNSSIMGLDGGHPGVIDRAAQVPERGRDLDQQQHSRVFSDDDGMDDDDDGTPVSPTETPVRARPGPGSSAMESRSVLTKGGSRVRTLLRMGAAPLA